MSNEMFESIKGALNDDKGKSSFSEILRTEIGNTYEVKLLPNVREPKKTFFHYYMHGWDSFATGEYVSILSPATFNERDPISEFRFKTLKLGTEDEIEKIKKVRRAEKWMVNVYVIKDPSNPENEGQVKILRYGKQLQKVIMDAIDGDDASEFGEKVFDFAKGNAVLKIKVDEQGGYANYTTSRFTTGTDFTLDSQAVESACQSLHDLERIYDAKSYDEVEKFFNTHYHVDIDAKKEEKKEEKAVPATTDEEDEAIINELSGASAAEIKEQNKTKEVEGDSVTGDAEIDDLLAEIE